MNTLLRQRLVPVVVIDRADDAVPLARTLWTGGLNVIEVTLRTPESLQAIERIAREMPEMRVGAGTILTTAQLDQAKTAGAAFGVAPGLNAAVLQEARKIGLPFIPGVMTPSEIEQAVSLGARYLKFFPAEAAGGTAMLKALAGPYQGLDINFIPTGGINAANLQAYLALPMVAAVGGSWFVNSQLIAEKQWAEITRQTVAALSLAHVQPRR